MVVKEPNGNFSDESVWTRNNTSEFDAYMPLNYSDGSIENDLPMKQLSELFNVSHFIVSQVNPHSSMLSSLAIHASVWSPPIYGAIVSYFNFLRSQCRDWVKNVTQLLVSRSLAPSWSRQGLYKTLSVFITQVSRIISILKFIKIAIYINRSMREEQKILPFSHGNKIFQFFKLFNQLLRYFLNFF